MVYSRRNLDWYCGRAILLLVAGLLVFAPGAFGAVDAWAWLVVQSAAALVFILWGVRLWAHPKPRLLWPPLCWVVLAFMLYAVARYLTADIEYVARPEFLQVVVFGFLFFAAVNNLRGAEEISFVAGTLIAAGTLSGGYAVAQFMHGSNAVWNEISPYVGRASGTYISPNNLSCFLALLLPLTLAYLLVGKVNVVTRILLAYAAVAMLAGLAVTFSRGGYIAAAAGIILLLGILLGHGNHRLKAGLLLVILLAGGGFAVSHYLSKNVTYMRRVQSAEGSVELLDSSASSRLELWGAAWQMWRAHPWFGVGPAHFDYRFREYRPPAMQGRPDRVHNDYLNLLADWGATGGVIVLAGMGMFFYWLRQTWPHVRREENDFGTGQSNRFAFFLGATCALTALAVHSAMDFNLHIPANALAGVILLALLTSNARYATEQFWFRPGRNAKVLAAALLGGAALYLGWQTVRSGREAHALALVEDAPPFSPARVAALEKAFAAEPNNFATAYEIGECLRTQGQDSGDDRAGEQALTWFATARRLNPHDAFACLRIGMCLDMLGRTAEAEPFYAAAELLDPNGYYLVSYIGWHYVQTGDFAAAREWFTRSLALDGQDNYIALSYLAICEARLAVPAAGK